MHPKELKISDFTYELPDERVAKFPLEQRDASKLLIWKNGQLSQSVFKQIVSHIPENSLLVFNNSKVVEARLLFQKASGGVIEVFALEPHEQYADITTAMNERGSILYKCLVGGASKWKHGLVLQKEISKNGQLVQVEARIVERRTDCFVIELSWSPADMPFVEILHCMGSLPIPPYLHRPAETSDNERYQTIYARNEGSVAAPTAGLHFTPQVLQEFANKNIRQAYATLHVGAGTFMPVKSDTMQGHAMHAEFIDVDRTLIEQLIQQDFVIPVGTTSMRTIESLYWMGLKTWLNPAISLSELEIKQWEVYDELQEKQIAKTEALQSLLHWMQQQSLKRLIVKTQIIIAPGYSFQIAKGLITNFHQPQSTLLLLVSAMVGQNWKDMYAYALQHEFRFLSYGDSCLLLPKQAE